MRHARVLAAFLAVATCSTAIAAQRDYANVKMKPVDTKLGFTISIPEVWAIDQPSDNNKFQAGSADDDFAVIITDFGPVPTDMAAGDANYRESFASTGFKLKSATEATVSGKTVKKYAFSLDTDTGEGYAEVVMLPIGEEMYSVLVATPAASLDKRQAIIEKILGSIAVK